MDQLQTMVFEVGQQYTNEKGLFTVVSITDDEMVMEFADGEQITSDIAFQLRIQERRRWETMRPEKKKKATAVKSRRASTKKAAEASSEMTS